MLYKISMPKAELQVNLFFAQNLLTTSHLKLASEIRSAAVHSGLREVDLRKKWDRVVLSSIQ